MKKTIMLIFATLLLVGCNNVKSTDSNTTSQLQDYGLSEEQATHYFMYINSIYLGFMMFDDVDTSMGESSNEISEEDFKTVMTPFSTASDMFNKFESSRKRIKLDEYIFEELGPSGILNNMEKYKRNASYLEKGAMVKNFNSYTDDIINHLNITDNDKKELYSIYETTVYVNNSFSIINEDLKQLE